MIFNLSGSGGSTLNFSVKAYSSMEDLMASTVRENTIGVITSAAISSWVLSPNEPTNSTQGMLWIVTGKNSPVAFNALNKNGIYVYPVAAKQYTGSSWADVTAKSYSNGVWKDWYIYVFRSGNDDSVDFESVVYGDNFGTVEITNEHIRASQPFGECLLAFQKKQKVDLSGVSTIYFEVESSSNNHALNLGVSKNSLVEQLALDFTFAASATPDNSGKQTCTVDVSGLSGEHYIGGRTTAGTTFGITDVVVTDIWYM